MFASDRKSGFLNPFSVTNLRPEVELCTYCTCAGIIVTKLIENGARVRSGHIFTGNQVLTIQL